MANENDLSSEHPVRINMLSDTDVAYWCRVLDVDPTELRRTVQKVGPRAEAVVRCITQKYGPRPEFDSGF